MNYETASTALAYAVIGTIGFVLGLLAARAIWKD